MQLLDTINQFEWLMKVVPDDEFAIMNIYHCLHEILLSNTTPELVKTTYANEVAIATAWYVLYMRHKQFDPHNIYHICTMETGYEPSCTIVNSYVQQFVSANR